MKLQAFKFDGKFHAYIGSEDVLPEFMADGRTLYMLPRFATLVEPPEFLPPKKAAVWLESASKWVIVSDHRGEVWFDFKGQEVTISRLGNPKLWGLFDKWPGRATG